MVNGLSGGDDLGIWMTTHPRINKIAFTGSTETGRHVMKSASETIKRVTLELGGNDPAIVLPDVDAKALAPEIFWAAFQNNAQFCNATKRLYVHEDVYDEVRDALVEFIEQTSRSVTGRRPILTWDRFKIPCSTARFRITSRIAKTMGTPLRWAAKSMTRQRGGLFPVTLVDNPPEDSRIVQEEPFGPILPLLKWSDEADVIARANDTIYGLGASVWGKDLEAVERIGSQLEAGTVWLNEVHQYSPFQAFGGHKQSGLGCENSLHGLMEYTNWQTITMNKNIG